MAAPEVDELLTIDQLADRSGITVRNIRYYTGRGLLPPPQLRGRTGLYGPDHLARLELVSELSALGFTLSAIESHPAALAEELMAMFQDEVLQPYRDRGHRADERHRLALALSQLKPVTVRGLVTAFGRAVNRTIRERLGD